MPEQHISISQIAAFQACRLRRHYAYDRRLEPKRLASPELRVGKAVHVALEQFHKATLGARTEELLTINFDQAWGEMRDAHVAGGGDYNEADWSTSRRSGHTMLARFWQRFGRDDEMVGLETEKRFERVFDGGVTEYGHPISSTIVGIADSYRPGTIPLFHELKTSARTGQDMTRWLFLSQQHKILAWLANAPTFEVAYTLLSTSMADRRSARLYPHVYEQTEQLLASVVQGILADREGSQPPPTEGFQCEHCDFELICLARVTGASVEDVIQSKYRDLTRV